MLNFMQFFSSNSTIIGLEIADSYLKIATIKDVQGHLQIEETQEISLDSNVNPLYKLISKKIAGQSIISTFIESKDILIRQIHLPLMKEKEFAAAIEFQVEPLLPYPIENGILQYQKVNQTENGCSFSFFATKKETIEKHLEIYRPICEPEVITSRCMALASLFNHCFYQKEATLLLHFSNDQATLVLVEEGKVLSSRSFSFNKNHLTDFFNEICRAIFSIEANYKQKKFDSIQLIGTYFEDQDLLNQIENTVQKKVIISKSAWISDERLHYFSLPIGAALAAKESINFRIKEFSYPNPWKRERKALFFYFIAGIALATSFFFYAQKSLSDKKELIKNQYVELLAKAEKPLENPQTIEEIRQKLQILQKDFGAKEESYPYLPALPKVSDILAWLSSHPQISSSIESLESPIQIENLYYNLVKLPTLANKKEHYQLRIDLEFTTSNPSIARSFHDALLAPNPFVDPKQEVNWSPAKGKYRVSFYIKDKTRYY